MQIDSAPITPAPMTADPISKPPPRSPPSTTRRPLPRYQGRQTNNDNLIASIDQVGQKLADWLSLVESALTTLVQHRPPSDFDLSEADQETPGVTAAIHQDALRDKIVDQVGDIYPLADPFADQLSPTVNMLQIGRCPKASFHTILEENSDSKSQGSMETIAETIVVQPPFPPFRGGGIFNVSVNSPPRDGETNEDHEARINRNANHA